MTLRVSWTHRAAGALLSTDVERGLVRAESGDWSSGSRVERLSALRALMVQSAYLCARYGGGLVSEREGLTAVDLFDALDILGTREPARTVVDTWKVLAPESASSPEVLETRGGEETTGPLAAVAIVTGAVATAGVYAFVAYQAAAILDRQLARSQAARNLLAADAAVLRVLDSHREAEDRADRDLPFSDAERAVLSELVRRQRAFAGHAIKSTTPQKNQDPFGAYVAPLAAAATVALAFLALD